MHRTSPTPQSNHRNLAWIALVVALLAIFATALYIKSRVDLIAKDEFFFRCDEIQRKISERLDDHARILLSGAAFFKVSKEVTREAWFSFTQHQDVSEQLPGIQGIGFSLLIRADELTRHIQDIREEGFPEYEFYPEGDREVYSAIIYLEPFSDRNLRAFGYDMFSDPVRRKAMEQARDTNRAALSGKVTLVQETYGKVQAGNLMYVPVYSTDLPIETIEERRAALYGWVYSPYRMDDLMEGVLGTDYFEGEKRHFLQVFDGEQASPQGLLYSSAGEDSMTDVRFSRETSIEFNDHYWTLICKQTNSGSYTLKYLGMWLVMIGGTLIACLLFLLIRVLQKGKIEALHLAEKRTAELRKSERIFEAMVESLPVAIYSSVGKEQQCEYLNPMFVKLFGYTMEDVSTAEKWWPRAYPDEDYRKELTEKWAKNIEQATERESEVVQMETEVYCKDGSKKNIAWGTIVVGDKNYVFGIDLTERINMEKELSKTKEYYRLLTEISPSGICMSDQSGNITYVSPRWCEITGLKPEEAMGSGWAEALFPVDKERIVNDWSKINHDSRYQAEFRFLHPNGNVVWVLGLASGISYKGEFAGYVGTLTDITELKKAEERISKVNQELEERVQRRTAELQEQTHNLEEVNAALKILLRESTTVKEEIEAKILTNIKDSVLPYLDEIVMDKTGNNHQLYVDTIKSNINTITSSFSQSLAINYQNLTPREIQIADFIRQGKTNKDIGKLLNITQSAVDFHRRNIRQKFNIKGKKENLRAYLLRFVG